LFYLLTNTLQKNIIRNNGVQQVIRIKIGAKMIS
jgi:hypothetical protein